MDDMSKCASNRQHLTWVALGVAASVLLFGSIVISRVTSRFCTLPL